MDSHGQRWRSWLEANFGYHLHRFARARPGHPLVATTYALTTDLSTNWKPPLDDVPRRELPQQLLDTGLTWYWQIFPGPVWGPVQKLTPASAPLMLEDLRAYVKGRAQHTVGFMVYGCLNPAVLPITQQDVQEFKDHLGGPLQVLIEQVGDWQEDQLWVGPEALPHLRRMLESWGFTFDS